MEIGGLGNASATTRLSSDSAKAGSSDGDSLNATAQQAGGASREAETSPIPPANAAGNAPSNQNNVSSQGGGGSTSGSGSIISITA
jgi:hypothetical protein